MTATLVESRTPRYSMLVVRRAQALVEGGWSIEQTRRLLAREFELERPPSWVTVKEWTNPRFKARRLELCRRNQTRQNAKRTVPAEPLVEAQPAAGVVQIVPGGKILRLTPVEARRLISSLSAAVALVEVTDCEAGLAPGRAA